jgi:predicted RecB family nuclease
MDAKISEFSATDIANFLACHHVLTLDRAEELGETQRPFFRDSGVDLLQELGLRHEKAYLQHLTETEGLRAVHIPTEGSCTDAVSRTIEAIRAGADVVYQATFRDGTWRGRGDFLIRVDRPSELGNFSYEVVETKLSRAAKVRAILQLCFYSELLSEIQGIQPEWMHVVLGGGTKAERFPVSHYAAYFRKVKHDFEEATRNPINTYPEPVELCAVCSWFELCDKQRRKDDHLSLVAGITRTQRKELSSRDINTVTRLGNLDLSLTPKIDRISDAALLRIREQARIQVQGREKGRVVHELLRPVQEGKGSAALPEPSPGDIFLDFEAVPHAFETGLEYLVGWATTPDKPGAEPPYSSIWSFEPSAEKKSFEQFIGLVAERRRQYPDLHIYHYAPYEQTAIKRLAGRHGVCVDEVDSLLRAGVFVDLYRIVRQSLRASVESYSIKKIEALYGFVRKVPARDAVLALQTFEAVLTLGDGNEASKEIVQIIEAYNRDDCVSALRLRDWLQDQRRELEKKDGKSLPRPALLPGTPNENLADQLSRTRQTMDRLMQNLPADQTTWNPKEYGHWLLAQMLEWHRREDKSAWWEYFRLCDLSDIELQEDKSALGGLIYEGVVRQEKRSLVHRYHFPPQDHALDRAREVHDPSTKKSAGEIVAIDEINRTIDLKRGVSCPAPHPTALIPSDVVNSDVLRDSLLPLGSWIADTGIDAEGPFRAERDLLMRRSPRPLVRPVEIVVDQHGQLTNDAKDLLIGLCREASGLPVQGPPGSGKTFTGARMIVELIKQGKRVGITANSHKVISLLLGSACAVAQKAGIPLQALQKINGGDACDHPMVEQVKDNQLVLDALIDGKAQLAAGTAWLWARAEMAKSVDVLFIDEAGQMSLANVLAIAQAATSLVLLGDPQQLDQPQKGVHPPGADASSFDHLLQGHATITPEQGLFLAETYRLHPDVCAFTSELFYESRLRPRPENAEQRLNTPGPLDGTGLRLVLVNHSGNQNQSPEEVDRISILINSLLSNGSSWTNKKGEARPLTLNDILVVAPYNAQVSALRQKLPAGARVGTVDKFQG